MRSQAAQACGCIISRKVSDPIIRNCWSRKVVSPDAGEFLNLAPPTFRLEVGFFMPERPLPGSRVSTRFPYSVSGFIAEPSQSAQRPQKIPRPSNPSDLVGARGTQVCVLFCKRRKPLSRRHFLQPTRGAPLEGVKRRARPRVIFSLRKHRFLSETGVCFALSDPKKPAGGPNPARASLQTISGGDVS